MLRIDLPLARTEAGVLDGLAKEGYLNSEIYCRYNVFGAGFCQRMTSGCRCIHVNLDQSQALALLSYYRRHFCENGLWCRKGTCLSSHHCQQIGVDHEETGCTWPHIDTVIAYSCYNEQTIRRITWMDMVSLMYFYP